MFQKQLINGTLKIVLILTIFMKTGKNLTKGNVKLRCLMLNQAVKN